MKNILTVQRHLPTEKEVENLIIDYLQKRGIFCWKNNSVGIFDPKRKIYRAKSKREINGVSDILGILPSGKFLAIEVKKPKVKPRSKEQLFELLSGDQKYFIRKVNENGGLGIVAECLENVLEHLDLTS